MPSSPTISEQRHSGSTDQQFCHNILHTLGDKPVTVRSVTLDEEKSRNAALCITTFLCDRLARSGDMPEVLEHTTIKWSNGVVNMRNAVRDHLWTNLRPHLVERFKELSGSNPAAYLLTAWQPDGNVFHVWAVPAIVLHDALPRHGIEQTEKRTVRIFPGIHRFERCDDSPDLSPFYRQLEWSKAELDKLLEAVKLDEAARRRKRDEAPSPESDDDDDSSEDQSTPGYTSATVAFLKELPSHVNDPKWHDVNKERYQNVLRDPTQRLVELLKSQFIERLSPEVAGGKRHLSILKKNDYGKGGYHDSYWCAFYDPSAGSKTKSVQLFFGLRGNQQPCTYGLSMGNYCEDYLRRLQDAIHKDATSAATYLRQAPRGTVVRLCKGESDKRMSPNEFAETILAHPDGVPTFEGLTRIEVTQEFALDSLPDHDETLVHEVGTFFTWAWPLFESSMTGKWPHSKPTLPKNPSESEDTVDVDVDEDAPITLEALSSLTSLPLTFLDEMEQALLAKQQAVLVGPPGTSKTYIARQFARYFVAQRPGRPQGSQHVLYMHANWTYEDFFEGIKPTATTNGVLAFQPQKGFFLEWTEQLKDFDSASRHVLVLDEINRCDTAAVLGELLQLLEYRGTTVRLLSGRQFVFPRNLYIIGTMNSADRSIGRMDLALRRRFLWLNLHPQPEALQRWLDRQGNNPIGFKASALAECNDLLAKRGIPSEQHVGHALFMIQESSAEDEAVAKDVPLTEKHLRRVVQFSVIPYVRELFTTQFGQTEEELVEQMRAILMKCVTVVPSGEGAGGASV